MRIGITGDTHGNMEVMEKIAKHKMSVDLWLHTGDFYSDAAKLEQLVGTSVESVLGNNDFSKTFKDYERTFSYLGCKIFLTHGHKLGGTLIKKAKEEGAGIVVYGHTHRPAITWHDNILLINPGSPSYPRGGSQAGFAVLELFENIMPEARLYSL